MSLGHPVAKARGSRAVVAEWSVRYAAIVALAAVCAFFSLTTPTFLAPANLQSILVNNFALLAIVAIGMTMAVATGGIDVSVGTAVDFASLAFVTLVLGRYPVWVAALAGIAAGGGVGAFNAFLIAGLRMTPFLATLGTLFIGRSAQQLLTGGGNPIYLPSAAVPPAFSFIGHGTFLLAPIPLLIVAALAVASTIMLTRTRFGRELWRSACRRAWPGIRA